MYLHFCILCVHFLERRFRDIRLQAFSWNADFGSSCFAWILSFTPFPPFTPFLHSLGIHGIFLGTRWNSRSFKRHVMNHNLYLISEWGQSARVFLPQILQPIFGLVLEPKWQRGLISLYRTCSKTPIWGYHLTGVRPFLRHPYLCHLSLKPCNRECPVACVSPHICGNSCDSFSLPSWCDFGMFLG